MAKTFNEAVFHPSPRGEGLGVRRKTLAKRVKYLNTLQ
jgi:hypothetical protein